MKQICKVYDNVRLVTGSIPAIKYNARACTYGAEYDLVQNFLIAVSNKLNKRKNRKTIAFIEPQLDSGYPDIVIIQYSLDGIKRRKSERELLDVLSLKILCEVDKRRRISIKYLCSILGFDMRELSTTIGLLCKAGLVEQIGGSIVRTPYRDYYCIKKVIAIEAKIDKWEVAIEQALHNTRFADESYILMKRDKCGAEIEKRCNSLGIGVLLMNGNLHCAVKASKEKHSKPYILFLFNEWIQRIDEMEGI